MSSSGSNPSTDAEPSESAPLLEAPQNASGDSNSSTHKRSRQPATREARRPESDTNANTRKPGDAQQQTPLWKILVGIAYMCAMGVCGIVLTAIGSTIDELAENCGSSSLKVSTVFLARGGGAICGALVSSKLYFWFHGNHVMIITLIWLGMVLIILPFCTKVWFLHVLFCALGFGTAVTDTGCQIMTRKAHGKKAGPWLGGNTVSFGIAGIFVPLIELATEKLITIYSILAAISVVTAVTVALIPVPTYMGQALERRVISDNTTSVKKHYRVEIILGMTVFCLIGGKVTTSSYIEDYIEDVGVLPTYDKTWGLVVLWTTITLGRILGLQDQIMLPNKDVLLVHLTYWLLCGCIGMLFMMIWTEASWAAWVGIALYGFGNGPCVGYCYDLNNRITIATEFGMAIVMFGLNFGASIVPYLTALAWDDSGDAYYLVVITFLTMFFPLILVWITPFIENEEIGLKHNPGK